ncbi:MAG: transketolase [Synergistaceae bacterium]|jgi:transketolase|nr:transketolase [Synergistaceae bacterium]
MEETRRGELELVALEVRKDIARMAGVARSHDLAASLALVDVLVYLYWERMKVFPRERNKPGRDRLVLGGGSAAPALYACLARLGFFERDELWSYRRLGGMLQGYPDVITPVIDAPGGTSGLGIALGISAALRMDGDGGRVFCILDSLELAQGAVWESLMEAPGYAQDHLTLVIYADDGGADKRSRTMTAERISKRLDSFEWASIDADGHDFESLDGAFQLASGVESVPVAVITRTRHDGWYMSDNDSLKTSRPLSTDEVDRVISRLESESPVKAEKR